MKKRLVSILLVLVMILPLIPTLSVSAGDTTIQNLWEFEGYGEPNQTTPGEAVKANLNFVAGKPIAVSAGDKITVGPCLSTQGYHILAYGAEKPVQIKLANENVEQTPVAADSSVVFITYTVEAGYSNVAFVGSQIFEEYFLVTKNQPYTIEEFIAYNETVGKDVKPLLYGAAVDPATLTDVFATGGAHPGAVNGSGVSTNNANYYSTKGYIDAPAGSVVYFVGPASQSYVLWMYKADEAHTSVGKVTPAYCAKLAEVSGDYVIYAYRVRSDAGAVRVFVPTALYTAGLTLATVNQPFDVDTYRKWCIAQGKGDAANEMFGVYTETPVEPPVVEPPVVEPEVPADGNYWKLDGYGEPNQTTAGGAIKSNLNFSVGKNIAVTAGDKITFGPCVIPQTYQMIAYKSGSATRISATSAGITQTALGENTCLLTYTVPEGVTSVTPVCQPLFESHYVVFKNRGLSAQEYLDYVKAQDKDATGKLFGVAADVSKLTNVYATGGTFAGCAEKDGSLKAHASYYCTNGYINTPAGSTVYFVGPMEQGYVLTVYKSDKSCATTVNKNYLSQICELGNGYAIYAYTVRSDGAYLRVTTATALHNLGIVLATVDQPFDAETYRAWCTSIGKTAECNSIMGIDGSVEFDKLVNLYDPTKAANGAFTASGAADTAGMIYSDAISVTAGDVIYVGPIDKSLSHSVIAALDASGAVKAAPKASELTVAVILDSGLQILSYEVPQGVTSVRVNLSAENKSYGIVTKNQAFDSVSYNLWYVSTKKDGENLYNNASTLIGQYATPTGAGSNYVYSSTAYIPVKPGDKIYASTMHYDQPSRLAVVYDEDFKGLSDLKIGNFDKVFNIADNTGMICYTVPSGVSYIRFVFRSGIAENMVIVKNKSMTRDEYIAMSGIVLPKLDSNSPLFGKSALFVGDSITFGNNEDAAYFSWPGRIRMTTGLKVTNNGDSGARVSNTGSSGFIYDSMVKAKNQKFDMIVMHGGVNDASGGVALGKMLAEGETNYDLSTYAGGLENMFAYAKKQWPEADLFYISNFHLDGRAAANSTRMVNYFKLAADICAKWGVTYIDLYNNEELNAKLDTANKTYLPDLLHPNGAGYDIITPYIRTVLEQFYEPGYDPEATTSAEVITTETPVETVDPATTTTAADVTDVTADNGCSGCSGLSAFAALLALICTAAVVVVKKK